MADQYCCPLGRDDLAVAVMASAADVVEIRVRGGVVLIDEALREAIDMGVETVELSEGSARKAVQSELLRSWFGDAYVAVYSGRQFHNSCARAFAWSRLIGTYQGSAGQLVGGRMLLSSWAGRIKVAWPTTNCQFALRIS